jgi:AbrB family looped-hinge helix DNA binding protein
MAVKKKIEACCSSAGVESCCIESLATVDERGQMVLSKALREKAGIKPGDKLAVATWEKDGKVCCITLIKTDEFSGLLKGLLGPLVNKASDK